ncbi:MAG: chloride channel protein, partial [Nitrososphaerota archaeon]|nr:chloride channel protein [Nitrososphaerota archaeon]
GSLGFLFGSWVASVAPGLGIGPEVFAVAGMAAVFGSASRAPLTSIVFALEVTRDYQGALPIVVTVVIAELVGEVLMEDSIMTKRLAVRGLRVRHVYDYNPLRQVRIASIMSAPAVTVEASMPVVELYKLMTAVEHPFNLRKRLIVVSCEMPVGVVTREQAYMGAADANSNLIVREICVKEFESMGQDEYAYDALRRMSLSDVSFVVVTGDGGTVVGYLSRGDLVRALKPKIEDETLIE